MKLKQTANARLARVEYATYLNTALIASHIGIPMIAMTIALILR